MQELQARQTLATLLDGILVPSEPAIDRAIQTAKQIGSSWPTNHINVLYLPCVELDGSNEYWRIVVE